MSEKSSQFIQILFDENSFPQSEALISEVIGESAYEIFFKERAPSRNLAHSFLGIIFLSLLAFSLNSQITGKGSDSHGVTTRDSRTRTNCGFRLSRKGPEEKWERKKAKKSKQINWFTCLEFNLFYAYWLVCK